MACLFSKRDWQLPIETGFSPAFFSKRLYATLLSNDGSYNNSCKHNSAKKNCFSTIYSSLIFFQCCFTNRNQKTGCNPYQKLIRIIPEFEFRVFYFFIFRFYFFSFVKYYRTAECNEAVHIFSQALDKAYGLNGIRTRGLTVIRSENIFSFSQVFLFSQKRKSCCKRCALPTEL